ncbi:MFS transporter [Allokutzneria albata]|uniref:Drug resistance transporter, EmrB/QacA subfamily n=1 Tax=Allokutzneria albata TaxID=211114 RepID=A0A1H0BZ72_ALLAB|nr:MFS transporter [Allokutzneria albata]SDN50852.1 drug resistance transporter, EmrB/QacA subfamily [Allokutzneria albata]
MTITEAVGELSHRRIRAVVFGLLVGTFLGALDTMIMVTAMRTIADELHGLTMQASVTTAYLIASMIAMPLYGKLSDIYGRKRLYLAAIAVFLAGSLLCALAQSMGQLAVFRAVQGLGGGGLMALALAAIADMVPAEQRTRWQALFGFSFAGASISGPALGGLLAGLDSLLGIDGWRWLFLINLPIGLVTMVVVGRFFTVRTPRTPQPVDFRGAIALAAGLVPLLLLAEQGRELPVTAALLLAAAGVLGLTIFVRVQVRRQDSALLPPKLFRDKAFTLINVVNFLGGVGVFTALAFVPLYLQLVQGLGPTGAGLLMLPQSLATITGSRIVGPLLAKGIHYKHILASGLGLTAVAYLALAFAGPTTPMALITALVLANGIGGGMFFQVVLVVLQDAVDPRDLGVATSLSGFSRQLGGVAGTAVFLSLVFSLAGDRIGGGVDLDDTSFLADLDPRAAAPIVEGFASAMNTVFLSIGLVVVLAAALALSIRPSRKDIQ